MKPDRRPLFEAVIFALVDVATGEVVEGAPLAYLKEGGARIAAAHRNRHAIKTGDPARVVPTALVSARAAHEEVGELHAEITRLRAGLLPPDIEVVLEAQDAIRAENIALLRENATLQAGMQAARGERDATLQAIRAERRALRQENARLQVERDALRKENARLRAAP